MLVFKGNDLVDISKDATFFFDEIDKAWVISYQNQVSLESLRLTFDIKNIWDIPKNIIILFFDNADKLVDEKNIKIFDNNFLNIELNSIKCYSKIKIYLEDKSVFSIYKWEAYKRKYKGILVSITDDGLGCRLTNMLVSMYLADLAGYKFGFVWKEVINPCRTDDLRNNIAQYGFNIILPQVENETYIFGEEFIKEHSYTQMIKRESKHLARNIPLQKLRETLPYSGAFGWSYQDSGMHISEVDRDYLKELPSFYSKIQFSPHIQEIISKAKLEAQKVGGGKFVALHLRGGDAVYDIYIRSRGNHYQKNMPIEIAFEILSSQLIKSNIVCFSDDIDTLERLLKYSNENLQSNYHLYSILEFLPSGLNEVEKVFFEVTFMSMAEEIFSAGSHFSYLASIIRKGKEQNFTYKYFSQKQQSEIIYKYLDKIKIHPIAQAFSYFHLYMLNRDKGDFKELKMLMSRAMELDEKNYLYKIAFLDSLLKLKYINKAELFLEQIFKKDEKGFFDVFFESVLYKKFTDIKESIIENMNGGLALRRFAHEISNKIRIELKNGAIQRVHEQLSYKLGVAYLQTNLFLLPFVLYKIKNEHYYYRKFQNKMIKQGLLSKPQPLKYFADYFESLKIKQNKEYKIGEAIIEADKSIIKWKMLMIPLKVYKIKNT